MILDPLPSCGPSSHHIPSGSGKNTKKKLRKENKKLKKKLKKLLKENQMLRKTLKRVLNESYPSSTCKDAELIKRLEGRENIRHEDIHGYSNTEGISR